MKKVTWSEIFKEISAVKNTYPGIVHVYGVPRGGACLAPLLGTPVDTPEEADIIIDDVIDSGNTKKKYEQLYPNIPFVGLFTKTDEWLQFPWEESPEIDVEENIVRILQYIGEDPTREGLRETPKRYLKMLKQVTSPPEFNMTVFDNDAKTDEMIIVKDIPFYSLCEHHLAPFFGTAAIAYIPTNKIVGISKLPRTLEYFSRRLQNQERITQQVAEKLQKELNPEGVAVVLKARHFCMEMRGVQKTGAETTTSSMLGCFKDDLSCRQEFLQLIKK